MNMFGVPKYTVNIDRVHLVWEVIPFEKIFLSAPIHSPLSGRLTGPSIGIRADSGLY
jgi:hypothetical protein